MQPRKQPNIVWRMLTKKQKANTDPLRALAQRRKLVSEANLKRRPPAAPKPFPRPLRWAFHDGRSQTLFQARQHHTPCWKRLPDRFSACLRPLSWAFRNGRNASLRSVRVVNTSRSCAAAPCSVRAFAGASLRGHPCDLHEQCVWQPFDL